jgi:hypothetical protein
MYDLWMIGGTRLRIIRRSYIGSSPMYDLRMIRDTDHLSTYDPAGPGSSVDDPLGGSSVDDPSDDLGMNREPAPYARHCCSTVGACTL